VRQTCCSNDFARWIGLEVQRSKLQADLARDGPDLYPVYCSRKSIMVEAVLNPPELMQLGDLPEDNGRNTPFRISREDVSFVRGEASVERFDQNMSVQIQHPKQLQLKRDRPVDLLRGLSCFR